ncbi:type II CRISPR RNA-guided endonuclease Cas9 [Helicobacter apodemus]|uniref:CRISPR-associated endonuclease Cas9 n=1 Tax=Helicobacter apodemus TaxID=135569 RepID=A0A2U8FE90_9HELI|nr:type II CRISPR RNA-guided endonuclease Cas9 [Helicobacter apodemus]AWI34464.1 type II CRISPR RNA-guided endonuclease Cas9 [Helicobacter apodemus]
MKILSFDIGVTSIGWAYVEGEKLKDCGVRIFTKAENPENGDSLAAPRREARGVRRRLARRKVRLNVIKRLLCKEFGLNLSDYFANDGELPKAYETTKDTKSPYELRSLALEQKLEPKDLARVILHIAKHRGYGNKHAKRDLEAEEKAKKAAEKVPQEKESTTTNGDSKKEQEKVLKALYQNETLLKNYQINYQTNDETNNKTIFLVGKYLYKEFQDKGQRIRNTTNNYQHTMRQEWLKDELEFIFAKQREFGFPFSEKLYKVATENNKTKELDFASAIMETAFYQRDLKSFEDKVGKCVFYENENRAPKDSLSVMEFVALTRIINTLKNLEEKSKNLGIGETYGKDKIQEILKIVLDKGEMSYKELRKILKLNESILFAKDPKLDYTKGVQEAEKAKFIELKNLKAFKKAMGGETEQKANKKTKKTIEVSLESFDRKELDLIATHIALIKSKENLAERLRNYPALSKEQVEALSNLNFAKHIDLSLKALDKILPLMREGLRYDEAVKKAGLQEHRKHKQKGEFLIPLKEYEPYLANPVVARALSEYRKVLNALLKKYGKVHKIHLEFTREAKLSAKERQKYEKEQREHFEANQNAIKQCEKLDLRLNGANILKMKLWIEQGEYCAYSVKKITTEDLKDSNKLQIDHIYPYSRSFDDSYMNKVLVFSKENQNKLNKTPFEAFGSDKEKWDRILSLSAKLPKQKQRRISNTNFKDKEGGFLARNIVDTGYIARLASQWTNHCLKFEDLRENEVTITGEKGSSVHIEVVSGSLTATLRHYWGLGDKDRNNHLHHAVDAIILAYVNDTMIQAFANFRKNQEQNKAKFYAKQIAESEYKAKKAFFEPCENFRDKVLKKLDSIFVSKPPRKRARGALHKETFYSFEDEKLLKSYGGKQGVQRAIDLGKIRRIGTKIVSNGAMVRVDIFKHKEGKFYAVPIYTMDFAFGEWPNKAVATGKDEDGVIKDWIEMDSDYDFCFSLFKDDLIKVKKKKMKEAEFCYFKRFKTSGASIEIVKHDNRADNLNGNQEKIFKVKLENNQKILDKSLISIQNLEIFEKWQVSPLGKVQKAVPESRQGIKLKSSLKRKG